ncbi:MAG TPA: PQQ-binding-like beta-propeller repeat protein [Pyrinomonadaceae bacterium]|nr:PQQ-binding-like beta-propeller repeat protein [Pyrinomonadaceae bacterium]
MPRPRPRSRKLTAALCAFTTLAACALPCAHVATQTLQTRSTDVSESRRAEVSEPQRAEVSETRVLAPGHAPQEREMKGGESHAYAVEVASGQFVKIVAGQKGLDVTLRVESPGGRLLGEVNQVSGSDEGAEVFVFIAETGGPHRVEVKSTFGGSEPGRYSVSVAARRTPTPADRANVAASALLNEATRDDARDEASTRRALEALTRALALYVSADEEDGEDLTLDALESAYRRLGGDVGAFESALAESLARRERKYGPRHRRVSMALYRLAVFHEDDGDRAQAAYLLGRFHALPPELRNIPGYRNFAPDQRFDPSTQPAPAPGPDAPPVLMTQLGHSHFIRALAFSPDGRYAVSGAEDGTARLWDAETGKELRRFESHGEPVVSVAYSPDGKMIAAGFRDQSAHVWEAATGRTLLRVLWMHSSRGSIVTSLSFSHDSKLLLTANQDNTVRVWDIARRLEVRQLETPMRFVTALAYSPDGRFLLVGDDGGAVRLWDAATRQEARRFHGLTSAVNSVAFSPNGRTVLAGGDEASVVAWDTATGRELRRLAGHTAPVAAVAYSPRGDFFVSASWDGTARTWDARTFAPVAELKADAPLFSVAVSPDGRTVAAGGMDALARLWQVSTAREVRRLNGHTRTVTALAFSPDGRTVLTGSTDHTARLWDAESGAALRRFEFAGDNVSSVAFSSDGSFFAVGAGDKYLPRFMSGMSSDAGSLHLVRPGATDSDADVRRVGRGGFDSPAVAVSPDGRTLASGLGLDVAISDAAKGEVREDWWIRGPVLKYPAASFSARGMLAVTSGAGDAAHLWDASRGGPPLSVFKGHEAPVTSVSLSRDDARVVTASMDKTARVWEAKTGKELLRLAHPEEVLSAVFSSDGRAVLTACADGRARLWDAESGVLKLELAHTGVVTSAVFSPDGRHALTASRGFVIIGGLKSRDTTPHLWDLETGREVRRFEGAIAELSAVAASPDGRFFVTGGFADTIHVWGTSGEPTRAIRAHAGGVNSIRVSTDSRLILTAGHDRTARTWNAATGAPHMKFEGHTAPVSSAAFSPDGRFVVTAAYNAGRDSAREEDDDENYSWRERLDHFFARKEAEHARREGRAADSDAERDERPVRLWDAATGRELRHFDGLDEGVLSVAFSPDGRRVAAGGAELLFVWDAETRAVVHEIRLRGEGVSELAFSPDGSRLVVGLQKRTARVYDTQTGKQLRMLFDEAALEEASAADGRIPTIVASYVQMAATEAAVRFENRIDRATPVAFSRDGRFILMGRTDGVTLLWDAATGKLARRFARHAAAVSSVAFSSDDRLVLTASQDATTILWEREPSVGSDSHTRRDTNNARETSGVRDSQEGRVRLLSFLDGTWAALDAEGRFETDDLESVSGLHWVLPDAPFAPLPIEILMREFYEPRLLARVVAGERFQPVRTLRDINRQQPRVRITDVTRRGDTDDAVDVTVEFESTEGQYRAGDATVARRSGVYDARLFRDGQLVAYEPAAGGRVRVDEKTQRATLTFRDVRLPRARREVEQIEFTAYAFNSDRVKSATARRTFDLSQGRAPSQAKAARAKGRAYLVTVGVNSHEDPRWDLKYAVNDARQVQTILSARLRASGDYSEVVEVPLVSEDEVREGGRTVSTRDAVKANVRAVFDLLAGREVGREERRRLGAAAESLRAAGPDDLVVVSFSSHGYADDAGVFYLLTSDTGRAAEGQERRVTPELLARAVSSDELSAWLRDVDAGELVMIIDACHAAQSVGGGTFKPGPMGARGLGQLAFDKGMRILTATQAGDVALESGALMQGLLTYALVRDGLELGEADYKERDREIRLREWLEYAAGRVPRLYDELRDGKLKGVGRDIIPSGKPGGADASQQQPALFDLSKRRRDLVLVRRK